MEQHEARLAQENILFQYSAALARGDFDTVAAILERAEADPILAQMIFEVNDVYAEELRPSRKPVKKSSFLERIRQGGFRPTRAMVAVGVGVIVLALLFLPTLPVSRSMQDGGMPNAITNQYSLPPAASYRRLSVAEWLSLQAQNAGQTSSASVQPTAAAVGALPAATPVPALVTPMMMPPSPSPFPMAALPTSTAEMDFHAEGSPTPAAATQSSSTVEVTPIGGSDTQVPAQPQERMIVKNGEIDLLVKDAGAAIDQVTQIATDNGGYVLSSQTYMDGPVRYATLTIAVRADMFETAMRRLRQIAVKVLRELATGEDVSTEYVDLQSRLRNLEATRDRIKSFLDDAATVQEALQINQQLADIEAEIEQVVGRMTYLSGRAAFSTITVNIQEEVDATPTPTPTVTPTPTATPPWSLGTTIERATETQVNLGRGLLELVTWLLIVPGPYLAVLGLIGWLIHILSRRKEPPGGAPRAGD